MFLVELDNTRLNRQFSGTSRKRSPQIKMTMNIFARTGSIPQKQADMTHQLTGSGMKIHKIYKPVKLPSVTKFLCNSEKQTPREHGNNLWPFEIGNYK